MKRAVLFFTLFAIACKEPLPPDRSAAECGLLFLGTSLTAGMGIDPGSAFPGLIIRTLAINGRDYDVRSSAVSGETSSDLLKRVSRVLREDSLPRRLVVVETGANDMLRSASPALFASNLRAILDTIKASEPEASILLLKADPGGARFVPGVGNNAGKIMDSLSQIAEDRDLPVVESLLSGIRHKREFTLSDRIHPNELGHTKIFQTTWPQISEILIHSGCPISPSPRAVSSLFPPPG